MKRAWFLVGMLLAACGGWDELAEQSRQQRCREVSSECDAGVVVSDAGPGDVDAGADAGSEDAGTDGGVDAGVEDAGVDAGVEDAGVDAGTEDAGTPDAGDPARTCTLSSQCQPGELCHPTAKVCAKTCTLDGGTCANCDFPPGYNHGPRFCSCSSTDCSAVDSCSGFDKVCMPQCTAGSCPGGRTCISGKCDVPPACGFGTCGPGLACDSRTLLCSSWSCDAGAPQPGGCSYGTFCGAGSLCVEPPPATCANHTMSPAWTTASTGPVIFATAEVTPNPTFCTTGQFGFKVSLDAYSPSGWPSTKNSLTLDYVNQAGTRTSAASALVLSTDYVPDGGTANVRVNLCSVSSTPFQAGFQFIGGNPVCVLLDGDGGL